MFLPPYSPDYNPIEESFSVLKRFICRWYRTKRIEYKIYKDFLHWCILEAETGPEAAKTARGHFRHAGIHGVPPN